eukprot:TRINITY_DN72243_c0_g1_i1.p1 TRINITY_DN72243_c0_g1~~TRINITY_DN72243_c0_g1_i1.p1  ORF type:complete len:284 (+),score=32.22 TRINITY_DN72243_c0_g1_i1:50-901(+)
MRLPCQFVSRAMRPRYSSILRAVPTAVAKPHSSCSPVKLICNEWRLGGGRVVSANVHCAPWLQNVRHFSSQDKKEGIIKMWNEERGFGFITPSGGGEDVFLHRSGLGEGVSPAVGDSVLYDEQWDDKKGKHRASGVTVSSSGVGDSGSSRSASSPQRARPAGYTVVGSFADWSVGRDRMSGDGSRLRHRIVVRSSAEDAPGDSKVKREQFQILGDGSWDKRLYPAGGSDETVVVLKPGGAPSRAAMDGKGHGRNWAVEGRAGSAFDIEFDPDTKSVSCESASE